MLQGFSTVSEEDNIGEAGGVDFVDMEAGGFDSGQGNRNVSNPLEADSLVSLYSSSILRSSLVQPSCEIWRSLF